jgi:hypothetical protein
MFSFRHEIDCLLLLIQCSALIGDYQYMNSISTLHHMHCVLKDWNENIESQQNTNNRFALSSSFFKSSTRPALYTFYFKFHEFLIAKVARIFFYKKKKRHTFFSF